MSFTPGEAIWRWLAPYMSVTYANFYDDLAAPNQ